MENKILNSLILVAFSLIQTCNGYCSSYDDDGDCTSFSIWRVWYLWVCIIIVIVLCCGGCGAYRRRRMMLQNGQIVTVNGGQVIHTQSGGVLNYGYQQPVTTVPVGPQAQPPPGGAGMTYPNPYNPNSHPTSPQATGMPPNPVPYQYPAAPVYSADGNPPPAAAPNNYTPSDPPPAYNDVYKQAPQ